MPTDTAQEKQQVHQLIDRLAPSQITAVRGLLEAMIDPVARAIASAPVDDKSLTADEKKALEEAREWMTNNAGIPHEQVLAELGITQEEIDRFEESA